MFVFVFSFGKHQTNVSMKSHDFYEYFTDVSLFRKIFDTLDYNLNSGWYLIASAYVLLDIIFFLSKVW